MVRRTSASTPRVLTQANYEALAAYRFALRRFLHFSAEAARGAGLSPQQYQVLLAVRAAPKHSFLSMGELAEQMQIRHHSCVGMVDRLVRRSLLRRVADPQDGRRVRIRLAKRGELIVARLATAHRKELRRLGPELIKVLESLG